MRLRKRRAPRRLVARGRRASGSEPEDYDYYPEEINMVGTVVSDWGPSDTPFRWFWQDKPEEKARPFGFARALED